MSETSEKSEMSDGNMVIREAGSAGRYAGCGGRESSLEAYLVAPQSFLDALKGRLPEGLVALSRETADMGRLTESLSRGAGMIWVGPPEGMDPEWCVGTYRPVDGPAALNPAANSPLLLPELAFQPAAASAAYIQPPVPYLYHNVNEVFRADFLPVLELRDAYGAVAGYPGVLMNHAQPALTTGRFAGGQWLFLLFDEPLQALSADGWATLLRAAAARFASGLQVVAMQSGYASYRPGERVQVRVRVRSKHDKARAVSFAFTRQTPEGGEEPLDTLWRCIEPFGETEAVCDFLAGGAPGLQQVRVEIGGVPGAEERLTVREGAVALLRHCVGYVQLPEGALDTPGRVAVDGASIVIDGEKRFWTGTHYYPSSSWWEWQWRDFRPEFADADFASMRRCGYRIIRVWAEQETDEASLRAMDAAIYLAARHGLVFDMTLFTQWVRYMAFERDNGERVRFEFRHPDDFNVYGFSLRNLALQREWTAIVGRRWAGARNLIFNLSNEVYVKDPDASQMDEEARNWPAAQAPSGPERDAALFAAWTREIAEALQRAGARQPVVAAYMFSLMDGGDTWACNAHSNIMPWHNYGPPHYAAYGGRYFEAACTKRPLLLEEFGCVGWNNARHYDANLHWVLGANIASALSYEWGMRWFAREQSYMPLPMRDVLGRTPDERWFAPAISLAETMPETGAGIAGYSPGFVFGSAYHGTPFPAEAAATVGRFGLLGAWFTPGDAVEPVCVLAPDTGRSQAEAFMPVFDALWEENVAFTVWRDSALDRLPRHVKTVICPLPSSGAAQRALARVRARGVDCLEGPPENWRHDSRLPRFAVRSDRPARLLTRPTPEGRLFVVALAETEGEDRAPCNVRVDTGRHQVEMEAAPFALVLETASGVSLVEGSGAIHVDGALVAAVTGGPAFLMARPGLGVPEAGRCEVVMARPGSVAFPRDIAAVTAADSAAGRPVGKAPGSRIDGRALHVKQEDLPYTLRVDFGPGKGQ